MTGSKLGQLWKNEYLQTAIMIVLVIMLVFAFWFGLRLGLNTDYPVLAVASGSMSTVPGPDSAWSFPFVPTLHTGDLILVEAVKPQDIYASPYNQTGKSGDILVFPNPDNPAELIVHRAIGWYEPNGSVRTGSYELNDTIETKGDWNSIPGPPNDNPQRPGEISANIVVGKVVLRIPWVGNLALFMQGSQARYVLLVLIVIIIAVELVLSLFEEKGGQTKKTKTETNPDS